ncbi:MAG: HD domain-containing phosphohydrolase [Anaerolineales bacterium]|nr:HD domain-containing protein [Anaerolineales bacterium]MDW8448049.1 HD domain-containing phosphohydrolase [Anaerolineales bacterium]
MPIAIKPSSLLNSLLFKILVFLLAFTLLSALLLGVYLRGSMTQTVNSLISEEIKTDIDNLQMLFSNRLSEVKRAADLIASDPEILANIEGGEERILRLDSRAIDLRNRFDVDVLQIYDRNQIARTNILHANLYRVSTLIQLIPSNYADLYFVEGRWVYLVRREAPTGGTIIVGIDLITELDRITRRLKLRDKVYLQASPGDEVTPPTGNYFRTEFQLPVGTHLLNVTLLRDTETYFQVYQQAQNAALSITVFLSLLLIVLSVFIIVAIVQPLRRLSQAARELANADFSQPYQPRSILNSNLNPLRIGHGDEIGQLVDSFTRMEKELHHVYSGLVRDLERANREVVEAYEATLQSWANALDLRDHSTERHTGRVAELSEEFARFLNLPEEDIIALKRGALLHDVGKMAISDHILNKKSPLTDEEWMLVKQHPLYGYVMLRPIDYLKDALDVIYCHHEKWDGSGYPQGLKGTEIPLKARIFSVIDSFDALITERPYRPAWKFDEALEHIRSRAGSDFDPVIVEKFLQWIETKKGELLAEYASRTS